MSKKDIKRIKKILNKLQAGENIMIEYNDKSYDILGIDDNTVFLCDVDLIEYSKEELFNKMVSKFG